MTQAETASQSAFLDSDRVQGIPVYGEDRRRIGAIERLLIEKAGGQIAYALVLDSDSLRHVIPWRKLAYSTALNGHAAEISEAELRSAPNILLPEGVSRRVASKRSCSMISTVYRLRVCPRSSSVLTEFSQHQSN
jgi:PRC-barrel domain